MDVFDAIRLRRSIKPEQLKPDPIPRALIEKILEAANWAPSHKLTEPWRFTVFTGKGRLQLVEAILRGLAEGEQATLPLNDPRRLKLSDKFTNAPVSIAIICAPSDKANVLEHEELCSTAMAVQNMHLAAQSMGLAGFWSSGKKSFTPEVAQELGVQAPARCLGFFFVGWPAVPWPEGRRGPWQDKVTWRT